MVKDRLGEKISVWSAAAVALISLPISLLLFFMSVSHTFYIGTDSNLAELKELRVDNPYVTILFIIILVCMLYLFNQGTGYIRRLPLVAVTLIWCFVLGFGFVYSASRIPAGDAEIVANAAFQMSRGNLNGMESYFEQYPFRLGLALYEEVFFRFLAFIFPGISRGYSIMALQVVNVLLIALSFYAVLHISALLYDSEKAEKMSALMLICAIPIIINGTSLSGRVPALTCSLLGMWSFLLFMKDEKPGYAAACALLLGIAQSIKMDSVVILIAILIVMAIKFLCSRKRSILILMASCVLFSALIMSLPMVIYQARIGNRVFADDVSVYSAMGLAEEEDQYLHYDGLYSAMNHAVSQKVVEQNKVSSKGWESLNEQWNEPSFRTLFNNRDSLHYRETGILYRLLCYDMERISLSFMNLWQSFVLFGFIIGIIRILIKRDIIKALPVICVLGGFLLHLFYRAQSQHAMKYYLLMIPVAANGFEELFKFHDKKGEVL